MAGTTESDAIVVGAGLSGLRAAERMASSGLTVRVLEARERVGGRTHSVDLGGGRFDIGGQWLGPTQDRVRALAVELGVQTFPTHHEGVKVLDLDGKVRRYSGSIPSLSGLALVHLQASLMQLDHMRKRIPADFWQAPNAARIDAASLDDFRRRWVVSSGVRRLLEAGVTAVFGVEPSELSMLWFLSYLQAGGGFMKLVEVPGGAQQERFAPGAQSLSLGLAERLGDAVVLDAPVSRIATGDGGVTVHAAGGPYTARRVVVAVPPPLTTRIAWDPPLPAARVQLAQRMPMGRTLKWLATYDRAFWRDAGLSGELVAPGGVGIVYDNVSHDGVPALVGLIVGDAALRYGALSPDERRTAILAAVARHLGPEAARPTAWLDRDWAAEPFSGGCPVASFAPGSAATLGPWLRRPLGPIHWAGTETATVWTGYLEGALEAGERAADEVIAGLGGGAGRSGHS